MKKYFVSCFVVLNFLLVLIAGCVPSPTQFTSSPLLPSPTTPPTAAIAEKKDLFIAIQVLPYYDSDGTQVNVGKYSEELKTQDLQQLTALAEEMAQAKNLLTPEQMYVLSIRLFNLGDKDNAIYWYYEAQFRAKLFQQSIEPAQMVSTTDATFVLSAAYTSFQELAGEYINGYAGCDLNKWAKYTKMVAENNQTVPELDLIFPDTVFVERLQWQTINDDVAAGLANLSNYITENGASIMKQREQMDMNAKYC